MLAENINFDLCLRLPWKGLSLWCPFTNRGKYYCKPDYGYTDYDYTSECNQTADAEVCVCAAYANNAREMDLYKQRRGRGAYCQIPGSLLFLWNSFGSFPHTDEVHG